MSIFNADPLPENPLDELVGEGKKYASVEDLAKAYIHADRTITQRNSELNELRTDLQSRQSVEEMLQKISTSPTPTPASPPANQPATTPETPDIAALVQAELNKVNQANTTQANVAQVTEGLLKVFGDEDAANRAVKAKAAELGLSMEFLQDVATKSPKAFFTTLGLNPNETAAPTSSPRTEGDVNPAALQNNVSVKPSTYAFYENMRKTNPSLYFSPKIQNQMHREALASPETFFKR